MLFTLKKKEISFIDLVWLVYLIFVFSFKKLLPDGQVMSTFALFLCNFLCLCVNKKGFEFKKFVWEDCTVWYGIFSFYVILSYLWTAQAGRAHNTNMFIAVMQIVLLMISLDWYVVSYERVKMISKWFCYACLVFSIVLILTSPVSTYGTLAFGSFTGMHRNSSSYILMFGTFFNMYLAKTENAKIHYPLAVICVAVSLLTGSRKIIFGYIIAIGLWVLFQEDLRKVYRYMVFILLILAILIPVLYQIPYIQEVFGERLLAVLDKSTEDGSVLARNRAKELAVVLFKSSPIIGKGWNAVVSNYAAYWDKSSAIYAHNNYLEVAADFGLVGIFLFYSRIVRKLGYCFLNAKKSLNCKFIAICFIVQLILDYGQITYLYLYIIIIFAIQFKRIQYMPERYNLEVAIKGKR